MSQKHQYRCHVNARGSGGGFFSRTVGGLSRKFGVPGGVIIVGFIMLFIMSAPLALATFLGAWYWVRNPGKLEAAVDRAMESTRRAFRGGSMHEDQAHSAAAAAGAHDEDLDFSELRARFEDLEVRARRMEEHVSSDEYQLRRKFDDIEGKKGDVTSG
ncbi:MAG: hypothetical protein OET44_07515 [Gammaproteobacteria bacterium]|nr:hypothetical protein [Gammaproteobacteria bacterium]